MTDQLLEMIQRKYPLSEISVGNMKRIKANGMNFSIQAYEAAGLGHVSVMRAKGFFGLMKMDTLIIVPTRRDMPLLSYDRVNAMGNDTLIFELYDTLLGETDLSLLNAEKEAAQSLPDHDLGKHWYDSIKLPVSLSKKGRKLHTSAFDACSFQYLQAFLTAAKNALPCESAEKKQKASVYVEGLLHHGGPSTDVFKKGLGEAKTAVLFRSVLFGTE